MSTSSTQTLQEGCCGAEDLFQVLSTLYKGQGGRLSRYSPSLEQVEEFVFPLAAVSSLQILCRGERAGSAEGKQETTIPGHEETEVPPNPSRVLCVLGSDVLPPPHFNCNPLAAAIPAGPGAAPPHPTARCVSKGSWQGRSKCCWRAFEKMGPLSSLTISRGGSSTSCCSQLAPYRGCKSTCSPFQPAQLSCLAPRGPES